MADDTVWGIHAGQHGEADSVFLNGNCIALGWPKVGDLSKVPASRDQFKHLIAENYPDTKAGAIPVHGGVLYRFVHEIHLGDLVAYPCKRTGTIHLGRVTGPYTWATGGYPHRRSLDWAKEIPRTKFSQGALYEVGSAVTLFQIRNYAYEYIAAFEGLQPEPTVSDDETVAEVAEDIEETTRDFILKTLAQQLKGHPFATFVGHLLNTMGYRTRISDAGPDGGIDILAHKDELGFEPPIVKVQVKSTEGKIGDPDVSALYGKVGPGEHGLLITLGTFTNQATSFSRSKSNLRLIDGAELVELILAHYEQFDSRYKGLIRLKRMYIPESHVVTEG
ncbi:MAG: restriction endonuclease [Planctomycetaceae bacterium]